MKLLLRKAKWDRTDVESKSMGHPGYVRASMSTHNIDASIAPPESSVVEVENPPAEFSRRAGEGLGVFRALLLMLIFYLASGWAIWFAWHAWRHWRAH